jgi:hypothetical protein
MRINRLFSYALFVFTATCYSADSPEWQLDYKTITGDYGIYGGNIGDPVAPQKNNIKIAFEITGDVAKEMFEAMGPDIKDMCTEGYGYRVRAKDKDNLRCQLTKEGEYTCNFGFNLRTGKSIGGSAC